MSNSKKTCISCQKNVAAVAGVPAEVGILKTVVKFNGVCEECNQAAQMAAAPGQYFYAPVGHVRALYDVLDGRRGVSVGRKGPGGKSICSIHQCVEGTCELALEKDGVVYPICISCAVAATIVAVETGREGIRPLSYADARARAGKTKAVVKEGKSVLAALMAPAAESETKPDQPPSDPEGEGEDGAQHADDPSRKRSKRGGKGKKRAPFQAPGADDQAGIPVDSLQKEAGAHATVGRPHVTQSPFAALGRTSDETPAT